MNTEKLIKDLNEKAALLSEKINDSLTAFEKAHNCQVWVDHSSRQKSRVEIHFNKDLQSFVQDVSPIKV